MSKQEEKGICVCVFLFLNASDEEMSLKKFLCLFSTRELRGRISAHPHLHSAITWQLRQSIGSKPAGVQSSAGLPHPLTVQDRKCEHQRVSADDKNWKKLSADIAHIHVCFRVCSCDSFSTSDISLEQKSLDDTIRDLWTESSSSSISHLSQSPCAHRVPNSPFSAPCSFSVLPSSSSSPLRPCVTDVFQFDRPFSCASFEAAGELQTPPPLPPKPCHLSEQQGDGGAPRSRSTSLQQFPGNIPLFSRRTSLSGLDHLRRGNSSK